MKRVLDRGSLTDLRAYELCLFGFRTWMITGGSGRFGETGEGTCGRSGCSGSDSCAVVISDFSSVFSPNSRLDSLLFSASKSLFSALTPFSPH